MILMKCTGSKYERNLPAPILDREKSAPWLIATSLTML
jgi:hypothetical protein